MGSRGGDVTYPGTVRNSLLIQAILPLPLCQGIKGTQSARSVPRGLGWHCAVEHGVHPFLSSARQGNPGNQQPVSAPPQTLREPGRHPCADGVLTPQPTPVTLAAETGFRPLFRGWYHGDRCSKMRSSLDLRTGGAFLDDIARARG